MTINTKENFIPQSENIKRALKEVKRMYRIIYGDKIKY